MTSPSVPTQPLVAEVDSTFAESNRAFARAYYLFATARLSPTYDSAAIYAQYPLLSDRATFESLRTLYEADPENLITRRLFAETLGTVIGNELAGEQDAFENKRNDLVIDTTGLGLSQTDGTPVTGLKYEDVSEYLKNTADRPTRQALYDRFAEAHRTHLADDFSTLFLREAALMAGLGYGDIIAFSSRMSGHDLTHLAGLAAQLVADTQETYTAQMGAFYHKRTGEDFAQATRADISYVMKGPDPDLEAINRLFPEERMVSLAQETFDGLGLDFSGIARRADFGSLDDYHAVVDDEAARRDRPKRILLDLTKREGKRSRAYVYPAGIPEEIYLSVKPEGGLDDYSAFFHESGHALHFACEDPALPYALAMMGNNVATESYAYLFQNLFLNRHWLTNRAGLTPEQAKTVVNRLALNDLYMLRRYAGKMQFEVLLHTGLNTESHSLTGMGEHYAGLLTQACGYRYDAEGWTRDVDAGFYVADYFTAWSLEAQLRDTLARRFGDPAILGEDWYANPQAGAFLVEVWKDGNITQHDLCQRLGFTHPNDLNPLLRWMRHNLA
ncbi:MAG: M3 family metallopeptidase [Candidatus Melainabacteria bacterium]